jgi:hypothetical protein
MPLSPGQMLDNRYRVIKLLGQGGLTDTVAHPRDEMDRRL